jgi:hypothetical protein
LISIVVKVVTEEISGSRGRGRPAKNAAPPAPTTAYRVEVEVSADDAQAQAVMLRDGAFVRALLLIGWPEPRRISLTSEQVAVLDQLARSALGATAPAGAPFAA